MLDAELQLAAACHRRQGAPPLTAWKGARPRSPRSATVSRPVDARAPLATILDAERDARDRQQGVQLERRSGMSLPVDAKRTPLVSGQLLPGNGQRDRAVCRRQVLAIDVARGP